MIVQYWLRSNIYTLVIPELGRSMGMQILTMKVRVIFSGHNSSIMETVLHTKRRKGEGGLGWKDVVKS